MVEPTSPLNKDLFLQKVTLFRRLWLHHSILFAENWAVEDNLGYGGLIQSCVTEEHGSGTTLTQASWEMSAFAKDQWQPPNGVGIESPELGGKSDQKATLAQESPTWGKIGERELVVGSSWTERSEPLRQRVNGNLQLGWALRAFVWV